MRAYIQRLLQAQGYEVQTAPDGSAALKAATDRPPDLILTDVMMPGLDGFGLLRELRRQPGTRETPVILVSARAGEEAKIEGLEAGADDYVVKPFSARELYARVASAIQLAELRREAAKAVEDESLRLRGLFEQAPGFITILTGPDHVFEFANASYRRLLGDRPLIGKPVREAVQEVQGQGYFELLDGVYATGQRFVGREAPLRLQSPDGSEPRVVLMDFIYEPIRSPDGEVTGIFVEGYEVTDRVAAQSALRAREEQLRLATEAAEIGLWDVDNTNDTLYWPPRLKAMFGISPDVKVTMEDFYAGLHPEDREATAAAYFSANDPVQRALYDVEYRTIGKEDGVIRWVAAKGRGVFDDQGRCVRVIGTAIDITERKSREARLKELNELLERRMTEALAEKKILADIVDGTDIFVQVADADYNWLAINKASSAEFARIFGGRLPHAGDNMLAMLDGKPEHQAAVKKVWARALAGEEFVEVEDFGDPSLGRRFYEMRFRTLRNALGQPVGAYQFVSDVTERLREQDRLKEAEAALAQSQKMEAVGQLTGGIAHDFNNLLGAVVGSFDLIRRKPADSERVRRYAEAGLQAAERGAKLTAQLLAFSRAQRIETKPVIVSDLVRGMHDLLDRTLGPLIRLKVDLHADGTVLSDPTQLEMAILNLAINGRDAMPEGGDLTITTTPLRIHNDSQLEAGDYVELAVADTGTGMSAEVAARAFDPFFTTKGVGKGTGLGLSQVYGIARQAGGTVRIDSRPQAGTTVRLYLRKTHTLAEATATQQPDATGGGVSAKILVVDDDPDMRRVLAASLEALGYEVAEAGDGPSALAMFDQTAPDIMIVDFAMPDMNGAEVARAVRERRRNLPIIFASGYAETEKIERAIGNATILRKPFRLNELQAVLDKALQADSPNSD
jgi:PAS domain S-box-containing protein